MSICAPMPYSRVSTGRPSLEVRVDGVEAVVLEVVGLQLVGDADAAALVAAQVDDDAAARLGDRAQRVVELGAAVAAVRAEDVAREALAVHAHEHGSPPLTSPLTSARCSTPSMHRLPRVARELPWAVGTRALATRRTSRSVRQAVPDELGDRVSGEAGGGGRARSSSAPRGHAPSCPR